MSPNMDTSDTMSEKGKPYVVEIGTYDGNTLPSKSSKCKSSIIKVFVTCALASMVIVLAFGILCAWVHGLAAEDVDSGSAATQHPLMARIVPSFFMGENNVAENEVISTITESHVTENFFMTAVPSKFISNNTGDATTAAPSTNSTNNGHEVEPTTTHTPLPVSDVTMTMSWSILNITSTSSSAVVGTALFTGTALPATISGSSLVAPINGQAPSVNEVPGIESIVETVTTSFTTLFSTIVVKTHSKTVSEVVSTETLSNHSDQCTPNQVTITVSITSTPVASGQAPGAEVPIITGEDTTDTTRYTTIWASDPFSTDAVGILTRSTGATPCTITPSLNAGTSEATVSTGEPTSSPGIWTSPLVTSLSSTTQTITLAPSETLVPAMAGVFHIQGITWTVAVVIVAMVYHL